MQTMDYNRVFELCAVFNDFNTVHGESNTLVDQPCNL